MLGLADQVDRDDPRVGTVVGEHQRLGGASDDIDANAPEQEALRFGHKPVPRACKHIGWVTGEVAECHGGDGLHATEAHDRVGTRE